MIPHVYFRRLPYQRFRRCTTCGFIAREPGSHIAHAAGRNRGEVTV